MHKVILVAPESKETANDVALHNLTQSDPKRNLELFTAASFGWFAANKNKTYQDLERVCRELKLDTHIIARPVDPEKVKLSLRNNFVNQEKLMHQSWFSCRNAQEARKELLTYHKSYEDNFQALKTTGDWVVEESQLSQIPLRQDLKEGENVKPIQSQTFYQRVCQNEGKLVYVPLTLEDVRQDIMSQYEGKEPDLKLMGISSRHHGGTILGFHIQERCVHPIGVCIYYDGDHQQVRELVNLNSVFFN